jgi:hypothetical protein
MSSLKIGQIGDVNPIEYGGGIIFKTYDSPMLEWVDGLDETHPKAWDLDLTNRWQTDKVRMEVYQADLHDSGESFLSWYDWIDWQDIATFTGQAVAVYSAGELTSVESRASALHDAASYHGWANFDEYPLRLTLTELLERWGYDAPEYPPMEIRLSQSDDDDGSVTVYCDNQEACKHDQSISVPGQSSCWETPGDMDIGYASLMDYPDLVKDLQAAGYEVDESEYWTPDADDLAYWAHKSACEHSGNEPMDRDTFLDSKEGSAK